MGQNWDWRFKREGEGGCNKPIEAAEKAEGELITILVQEYLDGDQDVDQVVDQVGDDDEGGGGVWSGASGGCGIY